MKTIKVWESVRIFLLLLMLIGCMSNRGLSQDKTVSPNEKREAEKAWEALIKSKGGREKLHSITNMLTEFLGEVKLDVFPDKRWQFGIHLDGTSFVTRWDVNNSIGDYVTTRTVPEKFDDIDEENAGVIVYQIVPFLLETKWNKPEPQQITRVKQGKKNFDVIQTLLGKERIDFVFEPEEILVTEVRFYEKGLLKMWYELSNYTEIDDIKMPQIFTKKFDYKRLDSPPIPVKFTFNVKYDPQLFERPLKATTPDAWKPQKQTN